MCTVPTSFTYVDDREKLMLQKSLLFPYLESRSIFTAHNSSLHHIIITSATRRKCVFPHFTLWDRSIVVLQCEQSREAIVERKTVQP